MSPKLPLVAPFSFQADLFSRLCFDPIVHFFRLSTAHLINEDTLLPMIFLGLRKLGNICCGHKMFLNKIRNIFCFPDTKLCPQQMLRGGKRGNICVGNNVSATMCPRLPAEPLFNCDLHLCDICIRRRVKTNTWGPTSSLGVLIPVATKLEGTLKPVRSSESSPKASELLWASRSLLRAVVQLVRALASNPRFPI